MDTINHKLSLFYKFNHQNRKEYSERELKEHKDDEYYSSFLKWKEINPFTLKEKEKWEMEINKEKLYKDVKLKQISKKIEKKRQKSMKYFIQTIQLDNILNLENYIEIHDKYIYIFDYYGLIIKYDQDEEDLRRKLFQTFNTFYESKPLRSILSFYILITDISSLQDEIIQFYCNFIFNLKIEDEIFEILSKIESETDNLIEVIKEKLLDPEAFDIKEFLEFILKNLSKFEKYYILFREIFYDKIDEYYVELIEIWLNQIKNF